MHSKLEKLNNMTSKKLARSMVYISTVIYFVTFFSISSIDFILKSSLTSASQLSTFIRSFQHSLILVGPAIFLSTIIVLVLLRPIFKIMIHEEKGNQVSDQEIKAADNRINSISKIIYSVNMIFALVYFIIVSDVTKLENLLQMFNNISIFFLSATVLNISFQELLVKPKTMLKKHKLESRKGQWLIRNAQHLFFFVSMILIFSTLFYVSSFTLRELGLQIGRSVQPFIDKGQDLTESPLLNSVVVTGETITFIYIKIMVLLTVTIGLSHYSIEISRKSQTVILKGLLHDLGSGNADLTNRVLIVQNDEMGDISSELNRLLENLQNMFISMSNESEKVVNSTNNIATVLEQTLSATSQNISSLDKIENLTNSSTSVVTNSSETVDKMFLSLDKVHQNVLSQLSSVEETSTAMEETDANIKSVGNITRQAFKITEDLNNLTSEGKTSVVNSMNAVKDIEISVDAVNTLVFEISKIIAQTNILAMNAAIEAAHAGEVGKGFAVVATEVRKLADNSAKKLVNISENMKIVMENVNNGVSLSVSANNSLEKIDGMSKETVQLMTSLDSAMNEQTQATTDILNAVQSLAESTKSIHGLTNLQQEQSIDVKESLDKSTDAFNNIQSGTYEIIDNNREVLSGINNLKEVIKSNQDVVNQMNSLIKGYKI